MKQALEGALWIALVLYCTAQFVGEPAIVDNDCGNPPPYDQSHRDEWFAYGDCSGDYGIIDAVDEADL